MAFRYAIALGSNMPHHRYGAPAGVLEEAFARLGQSPLRCLARSKICTSRPIGPSKRRYANAAVLIETALLPDALLQHLRGIESLFGRHRRGQSWSARVLDLDIILWSCGAYSDADLTIPHVAFRGRPFVLKPLSDVASDWRDPISGRRIRHLAFRAWQQPA